MSRIRKGCLGLFLIGCFFLLSGCWNQIEVDQLAIVTAIGLDKNKDGKIQFSAEIVAPREVAGGGGGGQQSSGGRGSGYQKIVRSASGETLASAIENLQEKVPRKIFLGQTEVVVIGEALARSGFRGQLDYLSREPESRLNLYPFVCKGKARDILQIAPTLETQLSNVLANESDFERKRRMTLNDLLQELGRPEETAVIPWVQMTAAQSFPYIKGEAILKKGKLIATTGKKGTKGLSWLRNDLSETNIDVNLGSKGKVSLDLVRSNARFIPAIKNGKWMMDIQIQTVDDLVQNTTTKNTSNLKINKLIQKKAAEKIKKIVNRVIQKAQKRWKADALGFG
ncbi:MAG TPA: Ger(x)C family spore germination protein, partial [Bacillales bacterium]|nr:Ger(x)C family spore germination protein [Bacillales bacterium]